MRYTKCGVSPEVSSEVCGDRFVITAEEDSANSDEGTEDLPSQQAKEEFIADETFIEGDEIEKAKETEGEIEEQESNEGDAPEEETDNTPSEGSDDEEKDDDEKKQ